MTPDMLVAQLRSSEEWFDRSSRCLAEDDSAFAPSEGMMTAAQQVAHVAQTIDWFGEGAFGGGFSMDFEGMGKELAQVTSLTRAREWFAKSNDRLAEILISKSAEELLKPLPEGPIMGGLPLLSIVSAIADHSAHHRGALTVYSRLLGKTAAMPYMEMAAPD